jgi:polysaccharide biosynthesis protein PslH
MRILAISSGYGLFRPKSGGRSRFYNIIRELSKRNDVHIIQPTVYKSENDNSMAHTTYFINAFGEKTFALLADFNPSFLVNVTRSILRFKPQIIQVSSPFGLMASKIIVKICHSKSKVVYDAHNVESDIYSLGAKSVSERLFVSLYITWLEKNAINNADKVLAVSRGDATRLATKFRQTPSKFVVVPSGAILYPKTRRNRDGSKSMFVFHGSYFHPPNKEAIELIKNYIAPKLRELYPLARFVIAGDGVPAFKQENVESLGYVSDLYGLLATADIGIVPILNGGGTRLKILDYMSMGLPIVTTQKGIEGIDFSNIEAPAKIVSKVDGKFIKAIVELLKSPMECRELGTKARQLVEDSYNWTIIGNNLNNVYRKLWSQNA